MNKFRMSGLALVLALLATTPQSAQAICCVQPAWWQFWLSNPTMMDQVSCVASKSTAPMIGLLATYGAIKYGPAGARWAVGKAAQVPQVAHMAAWAKKRLAKAPQKQTLKSRAASVANSLTSTVAAVVKPFGDRAEYAEGSYKPAGKGKWFFTRTDKAGNRFETDWLFRPKKANVWSGKAWALSSATDAAKDRMNAIRTRFGHGTMGNAAVTASNFMNRHSWLGNTLYYPALAAAGYYGYKGAELAYEKVAEIWADYQAQDLLSGIIDKANEQLENPDSLIAKSPLAQAVIADEELAEQINKLSQSRQIALRAAMSQFDKAFALQNPQLRAAALNQAIDRMSLVCNAA